MKKHRIRNEYNYDHTKESDFEEIDEVSMTIPDESYTIQELVQKHSSGIIDPTIEKNGMYEEDPSHDDYDMREIANRDLVEREQIQINELQKMEAHKKQTQKKAELKEEQLQSKSDDQEVSKKTAVAEKEETKKEVSN